MERRCDTKNSEKAIVFDFCPLAFVYPNARPIMPGPHPPMGDETLNKELKLEQKVERIEDRQKLLVEAAQNNLERIYYISSAVAAFFGLFMVIGAIKGLVDDRRRGRLEQQHIQHIQGMMSAFGDNVSKINSFITTLTGTFSVQEDLASRMKKLDDRLQTLDQDRKQQQVSFRSQVDVPNSACADAFKTCRIHRRDRESLKKRRKPLVSSVISNTHGHPFYNRRCRRKY